MLTFGGESAQNSKYLKTLSSDFNILWVPEDRNFNADPESINSKLHYYSL